MDYSRWGPGPYVCDILIPEVQGAMTNMTHPHYDIYHMHWLGAKYSPPPWYLDMVPGIILISNPTHYRTIVVNKPPAWQWCYFKCGSLYGIYSTRWWSISIECAVFYEINKLRPHQVLKLHTPLHHKLWDVFIWMVNVHWLQEWINHVLCRNEFKSCW